MDGRNEGPPSASAEIGRLFAARGQRIKELKAQLEAQQAINAAQFRDQVKLEERINELEQSATYYKQHREELQKMLIDHKICPDCGQPFNECEFAEQWVNMEN